MTILTDEQQSFVGTIGRRDMAAYRASLRGVMGVYLDGHASLQEGFVGNHALQFGKRPLGIHGIGLPLLDGDALGAFPVLLPRMRPPFGPLSNIGQMFQADEAVGVPGHDAFGDHMIGVGFQPSLSSTDRHQSPCSRTSAFFLQTLSQSRIMVRFGNNLFPRMERTASLRITGHGQIAHTYVYADHTGMGVRGSSSRLNFQGDQQVKLLVGFVIPEQRQGPCLFARLSE